MASVATTKAAEHLKARELSSGDWIYRDDATGKYYVSDWRDLEMLTEYLAPGGEGYSRWCADTDTVEATAEQIAELG